MTAQDPRQVALEFADNKLAELACDLLHWQKQGTLPEACRFHELAEMCAPFASEGDNYQVAERLVQAASVKRVAGGVAAQLPHDFLTHRQTWRNALERVIELEPESSAPDQDEKGFWKHELRAYDLAYADLDALQPIMKC